MDNKTRALRAQNALQCYAGNEGLCETTARDLMCDLRHYMDRNQLEWDEELEAAMEHYAREIEEDGTDADREKLRKQE